MKLSFVCALSLLLGACSPAVVSQPSAAPSASAELAPDPLAQTEKPRDVVINRRTFTIGLPGEFVQEKGYPATEDGVTTEFLAMSEDHVGSFPIIVSLSSMRLDDEDPADEDFGAGIALLTIKQEEDIILAKPVSISGHTGSIIAYVPREGFGMIQEAVALNRIGYVIKCGGSAEEQEAVVATCKKILGSFKIKE